MSTSVSLLLTIAFISGVIVDIFTDTPGINAASCTILAILRRPIYNLYTGSDEAMKELTPSISSLGIWTYIKFVLSLTVVYCATSFCLVYFSFVNIGDLAARVASSALLSFLVILGIDSLIIDRRDKKL